MEIERTLTVNVPVQKAWEVLARQFHDVGSWSTGIKASRKLRVVGPAGINHRQCDVPSLGTITERVESFDEDGRTFSYSVIEGAPGFAKFMGNHWWAKPVGLDRTEIGFRLRAELKPVASFFMGWMMKRQMGKLCDEVCDDLRAYIETGRPSPSKRAAMAKAAA